MSSDKDLTTIDGWKQLTPEEEKEIQEQVRSTYQEACKYFKTKNEKKELRALNAFLKKM